jgi:hypothetical protein
VPEKSNEVRPLMFALFARAHVAVLGGNRVVNFAIDCCRFSDAGKGKLGTILAHFGTILAQTISTSCNYLILNMFASGAGRGVGLPVSVDSK